jgi:hypothetical protein
MRNLKKTRSLTIWHQKLHAILSYTTEEMEKNHVGYFLEVYSLLETITML